MSHAVESMAGGLRPPAGDRLGFLLASMRASMLQRWQAAPPWARTPAAIAGGVLLLALSLLIALALVVQGVVDRSEAVTHARAAEQNRHVAATTAAAGTRP